MSNLWILTEERPKDYVLGNILKLKQQDLDVSQIEIIPRIENEKFEFVYDIEGINYPGVENIYLKIVSGKSSFFDYIVVLQDEEPDPIDKNINILYVVEETKTNDQESRNTAIYQRASKFVYVDLYYKNLEKYMMYNEESNGDFERMPSDTNIFGTNMLLTIGTKFYGKNMKWYKAFETLEELIDFKSNMSSPPSGNTPINIRKFENRIEVSGMLSKPCDKGNIGHDPNIGALSIICKVIRALGWNKKIVITHHGVKQSYINRLRNGNKFIYICQDLNIELEGIDMPNYLIPDKYWKYEEKSEKVATILTHIQCENNGYTAIYENHAGCERGYFFDKMKRPITLPKKDRNGVNLYIPDLILYDAINQEVLLIEGKQYSTLGEGIKEIENYNSIEREFIRPNYPDCKIERWITLFGGDNKSIPHDKVLLQLTNDGEILINEFAPEFFKDAFAGNKLAFA